METRGAAKPLGTVGEIIIRRKKLPTDLSSGHKTKSVFSFGIRRDKPTTLETLKLSLFQRQFEQLLHFWFRFQNWLLDTLADSVAGKKNVPVHLRSPQCQACLYFKLNESDIHECVCVHPTVFQCLSLHPPDVVSTSAASIGLVLPTRRAMFQTTVSYS